MIPCHDETNMTYTHIEKEGNNITEGPCSRSTDSVTSATGQLHLLALNVYLVTDVPFLMRESLEDSRCQGSLRLLARLRERFKWTLSLQQYGGWDQMHYGWLESRGKGLMHV